MESRSNGMVRRTFGGNRVASKKARRTSSFHADAGLTLARRLFHWGPLLAIFLTVTVGFEQGGCATPGETNDCFQIGLSTTIVHVTSWWPLTHPLGLLDLALFLAWNYLTLNNMFMASFFGGGYVPARWHPGDEEDEHCLQYCTRCEAFKAPRSHHCSKCDKCVMKMDHHCPWINNCVGHRNQVFFIRFLFFAVVGSLHACVLLTVPIYETFALIYGIPMISASLEAASQRAIHSIYIFFAAVLGASFAYGVAIALSILLVMQLRTVHTNKSGIEAYICEKAASRRRRSTPFVYPYDLGWRNNWRQVWNGGAGFSRGNGIWWQVRPDCTQFTFSIEQLEQKRLKQEWLARMEASGQLGRMREESCWLRAIKWLPKRLGLLQM